MRFTQFADDLAYLVIHMCVHIYLRAVSSALQPKMRFTQFADDHRVGRVTCGGVSYEDIAAFSRDPVPQNMLLMVGRMLGGGGEGGGKFIRRELLRNLTGPGSGGKG